MTGLVRGGALNAVALLTLACGEPTAPPVAGSVAPSSSAPTLASTTSASAAAPPQAAPTRSAKSLKRRATPSERFEQDQRACDGGDGRACRSLAERYRSSGPRAHCGVPRGRAYPSLGRMPRDEETDRVGYLRNIRMACRKGDDDSCRLAAGESLDGPQVEADRKLFTKKAEKGGKLPGEVRDRAIAVCNETRDCDGIYRWLDRAGYSPAELLPVRDAFAKTLTASCEEGDCTCGDATRYLNEDDPLRADLGILGCENGEAEGCYALGRALELGSGIGKDVEAGRALYDVACPPLIGSGDYSAHACDRLAMLALGEAFPGKDRYTAKHYFNAACRNPGYEIDHLPCVHFGMLWATREGEGQNAHEARMVAMGEAIYGADRPHLDDCRRPSVAGPCAELREALKKTK